MDNNFITIVPTTTVSKRKRYEKKPKRIRNRKRKHGRPCKRTRDLSYKRFLLRLWDKQRATGMTKKEFKEYIKEKYFVRSLKEYHDLKRRNREMIEIVEKRKKLAEEGIDYRELFATGSNYELGKEEKQEIAATLFINSIIKGKPITKTEASRLAGLEEHEIKRGLSKNNMAKTEAFKDLVNKIVADDTLALKLNEGLDATHPVVVDKTIVEVPDFKTRRKYIEDLMKVKEIASKEEQNSIPATNINIFTPSMLEEDNQDIIIDASSPPQEEPQKINQENE